MEQPTTCTPPKEWIHNAKIYNKVFQVICSCNTEEQAKVAHAMLQLARAYMTAKQMQLLNNAYVTMTLRVTGIIQEAY